MRRFFLALLASLPAASASAAAPPPQVLDLMVAPSSGSYVDPAGNGWAISIPQSAKVGTLTLTPAANCTSGPATDGTLIFSTSKGQLVNGDGTWSFGTQVDAAGGHAVLRNGVQTGAFFGQAVEIANGGQAYLHGDTSWWVFKNGAFMGPVSQP